MRKYARVLLEVFRKTRYIIISVSVMFLLIVIKNVLAQWGIITITISIDSFSWIDKVEIISRQILNLGFNQTILNKIISVTIAFFTGISISLLVFFIRQRIKFNIGAGVGIFGIVLSFIGVGCASCGSVIFTSLIGLSATTAYLSFLPFGGIEIGFLSLALILVSIGVILKKLQRSGVCDPHKQ